MKEMSDLICEKVKTAATVKVKRKAAFGRRTPKKNISSSSLNTTQTLLQLVRRPGGTNALYDLLIELPRDIPPMVMVQHIPGEFSGTFAKRLDGACAFEVREAKDGDVLETGLALLAPAVVFK